MAGKHSRREAGSHGAATRLWLSGLLLFLALLMALYPSTAQWFSARNQHQLLLEARNRITEIEPAERNAMLEAAHLYNQDLARGKIPLTYEEELNPLGDGQMARTRIPVIGVDLPVFHDTSSQVLRRGAGHVASTTLPVGGESTHAGISAHSGLPSATLFTNLSKVKEGDTFYVDVLDETLTYRVTRIQIVKPDEAEYLYIEDGKDLVTLITCTPIGINTDRILVTGERVPDEPEEVVEEPLPQGAGFPWWALIGGAGTTGILAGVLLMDRKARRKKATRSTPHRS